MDLLRELLLQLEAPGDAVVISPDAEEIRVRGFSVDQIDYHLDQIKRSGLIDTAGSISHDRNRLPLPHSGWSWLFGFGTRFGNLEEDQRGSALRRRFHGLIFSTIWQKGLSRSRLRSGPMTMQDRCSAPQLRDAADQRFLKTLSAFASTFFSSAFDSFPALTCCAARAFAFRA